MIKPLHSTSKNQAPQGANTRAPIHRRPLAQWIAAALAMSAMHAHAGGPPLSQAWLASQRGTAPGSQQPAGTPGSAGIPGLSPLTAAQAQQQQSVQQALQNLNRAAQAVATQITNQQAAQQAAQALTGSPVPDGIAAGGLQVAAGIASNPTLWQNANAPTQSASGGQTTVEVKQTAQKAILTWDSFNVGRHTTLHFDQTGGTQTDGSNNWIALNRINDTAGPSKIFGQIKAEGSVYLINRNGILFGAGSQVNTHSLLATSMNLFSSDVNASNAFFLQGGIAQTTDPNHLISNGNVTSFLVDGTGKDPQTGAVTTTGGITIEKGASIQTQANGYTLLAAPSIHQSGAINADNGTVILASADNLRYIPGQSDGAFTVGYASTTVASTWPGSITNDGLIEARQGEIQWLGTAMYQNGVLVTSTSLSRPGRIEFDGIVIGATAPAAEFGQGSVTTVLPEKDGETTSSSSAADAAFQTSSVVINVSDHVQLDQDALIEVPSGNVTLSANGLQIGAGRSSRIYLDQGAIIDVSGLSDVELPMSALLVSIPRIGQNELADSPLLRNSFLYTQKDVVVDSTQSGVRADGLDWVGSPVLNAAGYVQNVPRSIDQLMIKGGTITLTADQVITRTGSQLRLDGGYLNYLAGWIQTPNLLGADGRIYNIASADPQVDYVGFAGQYNDDHARWGVTETYSNPLLAGMVRYDNGFIQGSDAGTLTIGGVTTSGAIVLDGGISAQAYGGRNQVNQGAAPLGGTLAIGDADAIANGAASVAGVNYRIVDTAAPIESSDPLFNAQSPLGSPDDPSSPSNNWYLLPTDLIDRAGFARVKIGTGGDIEDDAHTLRVQPGGEIDLAASNIQVNGDIQATSGTINLLGVGNSDGNGIFLAAGSKLDVRGLWVNDAGQSEDTMAGQQFIDGGQINLSTVQSAGSDGKDATGEIDLAQGSTLDASSGGYVGQDGIVATQNDLPLGQGGDITVATHVVPPGKGVGYQQGGPSTLDHGALQLDGTLLAYGFSGGGTLTLEAPQIQIGGDATATPGIPLLYLPSTYFDGQGFANYHLVSETDARIAAGTSIRVRPANLLPDYTSLAAAPTGTDVYASNLTSIGYLDDYHRWIGSAGNNQVAGLSIQAGQSLGWPSLTSGSRPLVYGGLTGSIYLDDGASVQVDPGATVSLTAGDSLEILGSIRAPGGTIDLTSQAPNIALKVSSPNREIWLGAGSVLDASGVSLINPIAAVTGNLLGGFIPRTGTVLDGGDVNLQSDQYIVALQGALINVSGANDVYDLPTAQVSLGASLPEVVSTPVWSNGGNISLSAGNGMYFDGSFSAAAGAPDGLGGSLSISPLLNSQARTSAIVLQQSGELVPAGLQFGQTVESGLAQPSGIMHFAADRLTGSGIANLTVGPTGTNDANQVVPVIFDGDVTLDLPRSVTLDASTFAAMPLGANALPKAGSSVEGAGTVSISAAYVDIYNGSQTTVPSTVGGDGQLNVQADFIDLGGRVLLEGFGNASFHSNGDLRFYLQPIDAFDSATGAPLTGWLYSAGNLDFSATRIYPVSDYSFLIDAVPQQSGGSTTVTFSRNGHTDSTVPLSAGGSITVAASDIVQGGTLWVPSGGITLGVTDADASAIRSALGLASTFVLPAAQSVQLTSDSTTSVSLDNAVLPFGSTVDGAEWRYDGAPTVTGSDITAPPEKQIGIHGDQISMQQGAKVDLSGGGDLQAFEWVPGTGGSRDVLAQSQTSYANNPAGAQQSQYPDNRAIYAVIPGYSAPVGAHDAALEKGAGTGPSVGQAVYLSGIPGLPPGVYTLLPGRYATLPGAFRVVQDTGSQDAVLGRNTSLPDGTQVVSGYFVDALTGARQARTTTFQVQSSSVWQQYSQYTLTSANQYFDNLAAHASDVAPPLPQDAGRLVLEAGHELDLGAQLTATPGTGGRGSEVDIAGQAIQILGTGEQARDGYLGVDANGLSELGASSLLIGGTRASSADGDVLTVQAQDVVVSNDAASPLTGPEIILVTNGQGGGIEVDAGSVLRGTGNAVGLNGTPLLIGQSGDSSTPAVSGDGALLRVSSGPASTIVRSDVTGIDGPAGKAGGNIDIAAGATIAGDNALSIDATGNTHVDADALFSAKQIDVTANRVAFVGDGSPADTSGLLIGTDTLSQFDGADSVILRSRGTIDFLGDIQVDLKNQLTLDAAALTSDGGTVDIAASRISLTNDLGTTSTYAAGSGQLDIQANELDLGDGAFTLHGFGGVTAHASSGIVAQGSGDFDFGGLNVALSTPAVLVNTGADTSLHTTGALSIGALAGTPMQLQAEGGSLNLSGGSIDVATTIDASAGKLTLDATDGDLTLEQGASLSVAGVAKTFNDVQSFIPGGTLVLQSEGGAVDALAGSSLDISGNASGGNSGQLQVIATGQTQLQGTLLGTAAAGYLGGNIMLDSGGAIDLNALADQLASSGINGSILVRSGQGDLDLSADRKLVAHEVVLTADGAPATGGWVRVDGTIDASGTFGSPIELYGKGGVDVEGSLLSFATATGRKGGDITLGTSGQASGNLDPTYGYEQVDAADSGSIIIGSHALLQMGGDGGDGNLLLRAPVLIGGDVNVTIADGARIVDAKGVTLEAYAAWSTTDASTDPSKHFDGLVDPAGWYKPDPANGGVPILVSGHFFDDSGSQVADPDFNNPQQVADYLAKYYFQPDAANADHQTFYGYVNGDATQGAGTLMGFVENPSFNFGQRFASIQNFTVRPSIELLNPDASTNSGNISVLTNWNLGAGSRDDTGALNLAYRFNGQAPWIDLLATNNLDVRASITDGFFQDSNVLAAPAPDDNFTYMEASAAWQQLSNDFLLGFFEDITDFPDLFSAPKTPTQLNSSDQVAVGEYYGQYINYATYLDTPIDVLGDLPAYLPAANAIGLNQDVAITVAAPPVPQNLNAYPSYLAAYEPYLLNAAQVSDFIDTFAAPTSIQALAAPPTTLDHILPPPPPTDNSPSPIRTAANPLPLLSATLVDGNSSSYRLVAGADFSSANPLAVQMSDQGGSISLGGHTEFADSGTGHTLYAPTLVRTGTGDIDMIAAGNIDWTDSMAPAAVYTAGVPQDPSNKGSVSLAQPAGGAELVISSAVTPVDAGNITIQAGGDIVGIQQVVDQTGDATGTKGQSIAQYWWQWMQTNNAADGSSSSIDFSAFDQGVMSPSGDISVQAGGDIRQLSVSLPTTWQLGTEADGTQVVNVIGGGDLRVRAGGDLLSGSYFVSHGTADIHADGMIGPDFEYTGTQISSIGSAVNTPVPLSTLIALQDAQFTVTANGSIDIGGVFNPSWLDAYVPSSASAQIGNDLPAGHFDGQSFSASSSLAVNAFSGDLRFGSLTNSFNLFMPGVTSSPLGTAGLVLPATVNLTATNGSLDLLSAGELYPSSQGNLTLLAGNSVTFDVGIDTSSTNSHFGWGLLDASASQLPSPLNPQALTEDSETSLRDSDYLTSLNQGQFVLFHQPDPLHGDDSDPVRVYALNGDIVNGEGGGVNGIYFVPNKPAQIMAGHDIVDLTFLGQQTHASDVTSIVAGNDIIDTSLTLGVPVVGALFRHIAPVILLGGPGTLDVEAGRDIGPLTNQLEVTTPSLHNVGLLHITLNGDSDQQTGIETIGNALNPYLPHEGASISIGYGLGPGIDLQAFIAKYVDPSADTAGVPSMSSDLVQFMDNYVSGLQVDTGLVKDQSSPNLSVDQAWVQFQALPADVQRLFVEQAAFKILATVGSDYNDPTSPYAGQYSRGYEALSTLFPASLGYTDNGTGQGGINGAQKTIDTGDLDIRNSTIQTQQGGDIRMLAPGGQALIGSSSAPPTIVGAQGQVLAGPNSMGVLTLQQGDVDIFTDRSVLLAQSRIFTEQGGNIVAWSSNGDINAGKGAKTTTEIPPLDLICDQDAYCLVNPAGQVSGAGIATLQTVTGDPTGNAFLMAPRGTVDAGDAGIRVSGNLVIAAAQVANADNIQVQGEKIGVPIAQSVNIGALNAASSAANAVNHVVDEMADKQRSDARNQQPSVISVHVLGVGDNSSSSVNPAGANPGYDPASPVQVLGAGNLSSAKRKSLTASEQQRLAE